MREQKLQNEIRRELSIFGICYRVNAGGFYTKDGRYIPPTLPRGFSDLIFIRDGRISFVEVKVKPNKPSIEQSAFIELTRQYGCSSRNCLHRSRRTENMRTDRESTVF